MDKRKAVKHMLSTLTKDNFADFCDELVHRKGEPQVTLDMVEGKSRSEIREVLLSTFNEKAVEVAAELLNEIKCKKEADELLAATGVQYSEPGSSNIPRKELSQRNVPAESRVPAESSDPADEWLLSVRAEFIKRVSLPILNDLLDKLLGSGVISESEMESARTKSRNEGAREVVDVVRKKGVKPSSDLIKALRELDPHLYKQLN
ncbi:uncharacterized protein LOC117476200 [Trematomus bernacchii]|uniref:uncharacterized protein LOC117476200 n=1 Tax=Trematomus bernacchii TaxID=40690 RepID=UPI00146BC842|nr:uncharacterized protein LOC117476200 [Trematomus bernacchii]